MTPYAKSGTQLISEDVTAARYAPVVDIQGQCYTRSPKEYAAFVARDVRAIRKVSKKVIILAGIATDAGGIPVTVPEMLRSYRSVYAIVQGYWLNANTWAPPRGRGCAPKGCPAIGDGFLAKIGAGT